MDTYVQLKYRHSKIPEFYSKPKKNSIKGMDFITILYKCQGTNKTITQSKLPTAITPYLIQVFLKDGSDPDSRTQTLLLIRKYGLS
jgi:hypothetical protein